MQHSSSLNSHKQQLQVVSSVVELNHRNLSNLVDCLATLNHSLHSRKQEVACLADLYLAVNKTSNPPSSQQPAQVVAVCSEEVFSAARTKTKTKTKISNNPHSSNSNSNPPEVAYSEAAAVSSAKNPLNQTT